MMDKRHPTLQIFYLALMAVCYYTFAVNVYPLLPVEGHSRPVSLWASVAAIAIYFAACWVNPGVVANDKKRGKMSEMLRRREDRLNARYTGDGVLFPKDEHRTDCRSCEVPKPARSKHCRICGHCVRRFDHHCAWLNGDVGEGNLLWFHLFLVWHVVLSLHYAGMCILVLLGWIEKERLWNAQFVSRDGSRFKATWRIVFTYTLGEHPTVIALGLFAILVAIMLFVFWLTHLRNALRNKTSNELQKIDEYEEILHDELVATRRRVRERASSASADEDDELVPAERKKGKKAKKQSSSEAGESIAATSSGVPDMTPELYKQEMAAARAAFDRGSKLKNLMDSFGWANPPPRNPPPAAARQKKTK
jgi:palmitoyltransferase